MDTKAAVRRGEREQSVRGMIETVGLALTAIGGLCLVGALASVLTESSITLALIFGALACIVSGLLFLAVAEALQRLKEIAVAVRKP